MNDRKTNTNGRTLRRLLRGSWRYFAACIAASLLFTVCELVIPQIIRVSVDSLIGNAPVKVAAAKPIVAALGGVDRLRRDLWIPAALMAGFGLLSAIMRYCVNLYSSKAISSSAARPTWSASRRFLRSSSCPCSGSSF